jgi:hypothetical protein
MDARFQFTSPDSVMLTLAITMSAKEWRDLDVALDAAEGHPEPVRRLRLLIQSMTQNTVKKLLPIQQTNGYFTREVLEEE